jgi:hypothetical protein
LTFSRPSNFSLVSGLTKPLITDVCIFLNKLINLEISEFFAVYLKQDKENAAFTVVGTTVSSISFYYFAFTASRTD